MTSQRPICLCNLAGLEISDENCRLCRHRLKNGEYCRELQRMKLRGDRVWLGLPAEKRKTVRMDGTLRDLLPEEYRDAWK